MSFGDADDYMRLLQVRDWLNGQSWFDVTQYRMNPPQGALMHWSRLVDLPIAAIILLVCPWTGQHAAETIACVIVPMVTLGIAILLSAGITRRLVGERQALMTAPFCALNVGTFYAMRPIRIDHHGWEIVCGLLMVWALLRQRNARSAAIAGIAAALWTQISLEGLAFTALVAGWLGLSWILQPAREAMRLPAFLAALASTSLGLFLVAHGGTLFDRTFCDAISPVHMVAFALAATGTGLAVRFAPSSLSLRALALGIPALACAALYRFWAPQCMAGPFGELSPLAYRLWYLRIYEGLPLWDDTPGQAIIWICFPLIGLAGAVYAWRHAETAEGRTKRLDYAAMLALAVAVGIFVQRSEAFANMLAVAGGLVWLQAIAARSNRLEPLILRTGAIAVAVLLLLPPIVPALLVQLPGLAPRVGAAQTASAKSCMEPANLARLNILPPATLMTSLNIGPDLLVQTHHRVIASNYHRNGDAIDEVLRFFAYEDQAHAIAQRRGVNYVFLCSSDRDPPSSAEARTNWVSRQQLPQWLHPVSVPGLKDATLYAVIN